MLKAVFWDMDGTLIDSEPYWHESELRLAAAHGGYWDEDLAWQGSGTPVPQVARQMIERGTALTVEEISKGMVDYVAQQERLRMPWIPGVLDVLRSLAAARIPSVLVTTSPRNLAQNLVAQAPEGVFAGYICGDDDVAKKPDPAPYLAAGKLLGIGEDMMPYCVAVEDSMSGLRSAAHPGRLPSPRLDICGRIRPTDRSMRRYAAIRESPPKRSNGSCGNVWLGRPERLECPGRPGRLRIRARLGIRRFAVE